MLGLGFVMKFLGAGVVGKLTDLYQQLQLSQDDVEKEVIRAEIDHIKTRRDVLIAEQGNWYTAWIRPMIALPVTIYIWKIIIWDTVLKLGVTPDPGQFVNWLVITVVAAYFLTRQSGKK